MPFDWSLFDQKSKSFDLKFAAVFVCELPKSPRRGATSVTSSPITYFQASSTWGAQVPSNFEGSKNGDG